MKIIYVGPSDKVNVPPYGSHGKGETKDYPEEFARELLATSRRQKFEAVEPGPEPGSEPEPEPEGDITGGKDKGKPKSKDK